ncbi:MAG: pyridoxamine 5'-phosphate oxidase family protein [Helicobacteraceae bacterium]|nr:pyridoxamine 5'-phosphate oxidase family protein [Helicobacteraceae bacterium]
MRRKDRELDKLQALHIMKEAQYCTISSSADCVKDFKISDKAIQNPLDYAIFSIPISFVYDDNSIFIHTAKQGRKISFFNDESLVCLVFVGKVKVPDLFSKEEVEFIANNTPKKLGSHIFTTEYESVIAYGKIYLVKDRVKRNRAMQLLCEKYTPKSIDFAQISIDLESSYFNVYEIKLKQISAKAKVIK